jgi:hypothetical protein
MLGSRKITATLAGETLEGSVARGCPQGSVLSPLLCSLVLDEVIGLNGNGYYTLMVIVPFTRKRDLRGLKEPTLSGYTLQLSTEVKYLGLILDNGLTWKAQLKNVMNKAYRPFWTCKGTSGKTWGLKPRVVHWIYTMVMRPVLTLWIHGLVAKGQIKCQQDRAQ